jgi:hypothetical protein
MNRRTLLFVGAATLMLALAGLAYLLLRGPQADRTRLLAALDAFTGDWEGDASLQTADGQPLQTVRVTRHFFWIGEKQIVETRFNVGPEERATRAVQWIERGGLRAVETGPTGRAHNYAGALTLDGILWTNLDHSKSDRLDRVLTEAGQRTAQSASITSLGIGGGHDLVGVAAVLAPRKPGARSASEARESPVEADARAADLEHQLAAITRERDELRAQLERAVAAEASALAAAAPSPVRPSQIEIRSSPPGMKFEVLAEDRMNVLSAALASGTTPVTLPDLPPGDYAVILQGNGWRKTVHHVTVRENMDVFVFHRETDDGAEYAPAVSKAPDDP